MTWIFRGDESRGDVRGSRPRTHRRYKKAERERLGRRPFRCGSWKKPGGGAAKLPKKPRDPFAPPARAPLADFGSKFDLPSGSMASAPTVCGGQVDEDEVDFARSISSARTEEPTFARPRPRRAVAKTAAGRAPDSLKPIDFGAAGRPELVPETDDAAPARRPPLPPSIEAEAEKLDAMVRAALGGNVPKFPKHALHGKLPKGHYASGAMMTTFRRGNVDALKYLDEPTEPSPEDIFKELCETARRLYPEHSTNSTDHLPVSCLLRLADERAGPRPDHYVMWALREFPPIRDAVAEYEPEDPHGLEFVEFDEFETYFSEIIRGNGLEPGNCGEPGKLGPRVDVPSGYKGY